MLSFACLETSRQWASVFSKSNTKLWVSYHHWPLLWITEIIFYQLLLGTWTREICVTVLCNTWILSWTNLDLDA